MKVTSDSDRMAESNKAPNANMVESCLRRVMFATMEAEQRTELFEQMVRLGLSTKEVGSFTRKQRSSRRTKGRDDTSKILMEIKIKDSKKDGKSLRKDRRKLRLDLEILIGVRAASTSG